uniref:Uncharacterized protein n=1 Tax=Bursaphelenchus xylophilus TaxID=6326 RepID=A0A1I7SQK6_BURXY
MYNDVFLELSKCLRYFCHSLTIDLLILYEDLEQEIISTDFTIKGLMPGFLAPLRLIKYIGPKDYRLSMTIVNNDKSLRGQNPGRINLEFHPSSYAIDVLVTSMFYEKKTDRLYFTKATDKGNVCVYYVQPGQDVTTVIETPIPWLGNDLKLTVDEQFIFVLSSFEVPYGMSCIKIVHVDVKENKRMSYRIRNTSSVYQSAQLGNQLLLPDKYCARLFEANEKITVDVWPPFLRLNRNIFVFKDEYLRFAYFDKSHIMLTKSHVSDIDALFFRFRRESHNIFSINSYDWKTRETYMYEVVDGLLHSNRIRYLQKIS